MHPLPDIIRPGAAKKPMKVLSLFSGIGGIDLGLQRAGMTIAGQCEIDLFCRAVLEKHWPKVWRHDDVTTLTGRLVREHCGDIDIIAGGFPCQDISIAGKGVGLDGPRSGLWRQMLRLVREVRPDWVLAENVLALRSRGYDHVHDDLVAAGYTPRQVVVGAEHCGAPHRRHRVWIVAHAAGRGLGANRGARGYAGHVDQCHAAVANAEGQQGGGGSDIQTPEIGEYESGRPSDELADTKEQGCERGEPTRIGISGRCVNEHGQLWPARPGQEQHDWEAPRLVKFPLGWTTPRVSHRMVRYLLGVLNYATSSIARPSEVMQIMRFASDAAAVQWSLRGPGEISSEDVLQSALLWGGNDGGKPNPGDDTAEITAGSSNEVAMRRLRNDEDAATSSLKREQARQLCPECGNLMCELPCEVALATRKGREAMRRLSRHNRNALKAFGNTVCPQIPEMIGRWILDNSVSPPVLEAFLRVNK